jgi:hypothetical protein
MANRKGIGRLILSMCEMAARAEGFLKVELMATMAGEPLYLACGYQPVARLQDERGIRSPGSCAHRRSTPLPETVPPPLGRAFGLGSQRGAYRCRGSLPVRSWKTRHGALRSIHMGKFLLAQDPPCADSCACFPGLRALRAAPIPPARSFRGDSCGGGCGRVRRVRMVLSAVLPEELKPLTSRDRKTMGTRLCFSAYHLKN